MASSNKKNNSNATGSMTLEALNRRKKEKRQKQNKLVRLREQLKREQTINETLDILEKVCSKLLQCEDIDSIDIYVDNDDTMNDLIGVLEAGKLFFAYEIYNSVVRFKRITL